jgi:hypothetical protein
VLNSLARYSSPAQGGSSQDRFSVVSVEIQNEASGLTHSLVLS